MKNKYFSPRIRPHQLQVLLSTTSPGVSGDDYDPNENIEAKRQSFFIEDEDDELWGN